MPPPSSLLSPTHPLNREYRLLSFYLKNTVSLLKQSYQWLFTWKNFCVKTIESFFTCSSMFGIQAIYACMLEKNTYTSGHLLTSHSQLTIQTDWHTYLCLFNTEQLLMLWWQHRILLLNNLTGNSVNSLHAGIWIILSTVKDGKIYSERLSFYSERFLYWNCCMHSN